MRLNENVVLLGKNLVLVPYKRHHVLKYNSWMQQKELQELTASEPLSLDEEYEMQSSWHTDEKKLTFIILDKEKFQHCNNKLTLDKSKDDMEYQDEDRIGRLLEDEASCMIGDVNLFCNNETWSENTEISLMIAETSYRRKGLGTEAARMMMMYAINELKVKTFTAKISMNNKPSINMFIDKLHFQQVGQANFFNEVTLQYFVDSNWEKHFIDSTIQKDVYIV